MDRHFGDRDHRVHGVGLVAVIAKQDFWRKRSIVFDANTEDAMTLTPMDLMVLVAIFAVLIGQR